MPGARKSTSRCTCRCKSELTRCAQPLPCDGREVEEECHDTSVEPLIVFIRPQVWVLPVFKHIYASKHNLAPFEDRVRMCQLTFEGLGQPGAPPNPPPPSHPV